MKNQPVPDQRAFLMLLGALLVVTFYTFPRAVVIWTATAAPWAVILAGCLALLLAWPVLAALARSPGRNLTDLALQAGGRPVAIATALILTATLVVQTGLSLRQVSEMVVTALYPHTPQTFAMVSLLLTSALGAAMPPAGAIWLGAVYVGPMAFSLLFVLVGNVGWGQFRNLLPITGPGILPVIVRTPSVASYFEPLLYLAVFSRYLNTPKRLVKGALVAVAASGVVMSLTTLAFLMVMPLPGALRIPFPLFEMSRLVQGGRFFERLDAIWLLFWTFGAASQLSLALLVSSLLFQEAFRLPDHRGAVLPLTLVTTAVALFPTNQGDAIRVANQILGWEFLPALVWPAAIAAVAVLRGRLARRRRRRGGTAHA